STSESPRTPPRLQLACFASTLAYCINRFCVANSAFSYFGPSKFYQMSAAEAARVDFHPCLFRTGMKISRPIV
ncbi:MAG: hypothetical protein J7641_00355, partial [Cyanobacteria bacterium SID2]|nr:hypothetical protein [Cyanobacteria bacterium SID2]